MSIRPGVLAQLAVAVVLELSGIAAAQTSEPPPSTDVGGQGGNLSDKLRDTNGVIHPQDNIDTGMQKPAPQTGTTPVVPPPGSPGGDPSVTPK